MYFNLLLAYVSVNTDSVGGASAAVQPLRQLLLQLHEFRVAL